MTQMRNENLIFITNDENLLFNIEQLGAMVIIISRVFCRFSYNRIKLQVFVITHNKLSISF
ncbi:unnamed protein product [Amoebophrya sp. A25]|nr:unnamed protein product [Amoebophrya sp. A25]|eukprot:GSA25T00010713001.1